MKNSSSRLLQFLILLIFLNISLAEQRARDRDRDPTFSFFRFHVFSNRTHSHGHHRQFEATQLRFSAPIVLSGVLCFIAASISSAGSAYQQEVSVMFFPFYIIFFKVPPSTVVNCPKLILMQFGDDKIRFGSPLPNLGSSLDGNRLLIYIGRGSVSISAVSSVHLLCSRLNMKTRTLHCCTFFTNQKVYNFLLSVAEIFLSGGIGGGGLFIPILTIVAGLDLKTASSFSAFMVTGGSVANVVCNFLFIKSPKFGRKCLIDYDIALLSEPSMLLGVSIGVICNRVFPEWLITALFAFFLAWCTFKTCRNGILCWKFESQEAKLFEEYENGAVRDGIGDAAEKSVTTTEPLLVSSEKNCAVGFPWMKLGILVLVWFSFFTVYLLRGNRSGQVMFKTSIP